MGNIVIATIHPWNIQQAEACRTKLQDWTIHIITKKEELSFGWLSELQPEYVFFPHWSWIIPKEIYSNFSCIVFHMTDLPFGRGGSPLQNLIARGLTETKISAIEVTEGLDTGRVYFKESMSLYGSAEEIYLRTAEIIFKKMIPQILEEHPQPLPQQGEITEFSRRTPEMSELSPDMSIIQLFDHIRMLDAEGYPPACIHFGKYVLEFSRAKRTYDGIFADVKIKEEFHGDN